MRLSNIWANGGVPSHRGPPGSLLDVWRLPLFEQSSLCPVLYAICLQRNAGLSLSPPVVGADHGRRSQAFCVPLPVRHTHLPLWINCVRLVRSLLLCTDAHIVVVVIVIIFWFSRLCFELQMRGAQRSCSNFEQQMKCLPTSCIHALLKRRLKPLNSLQICVQLWNCNIYSSPPFCIMNSLHRYLKDVLVKYAWFIWNDYAKLDEVDHFCLP